MGFHCGNTPRLQAVRRAARSSTSSFSTVCLDRQAAEPDFTRGTLGGQIIAASQITFYRLQCDSDGNLRSYIAEGEILPVHTRSFGGIGIFAIHEMGRFYRHVLRPEALSAPRCGRLRSLWQAPVRGLQVSSAWATSPITSRSPCRTPRRTRSRKNPEVVKPPAAPSFPPCRKRWGRKGALGYGLVRSAGTVQAST